MSHADDRAFTAPTATDSVAAIRFARGKRSLGMSSLAFHATDLSTERGFARTIGSIGPRSFEIAQWRTAVVYPVLDHLLIPALPFPVTYNTCRWVDSDAVTDVTVDGRPLTAADTQRLLPYWLTINRAALLVLVEAALAEPAQEAGQRLWGALAGLDVPAITAMGPEASIDSLKTLAALAPKPLWRVHFDADPQPSTPALPPSRPTLGHAPTTRLSLTLPPQP